MTHQPRLRVKTAGNCNNSYCNSAVYDKRHEVIIIIREGEDSSTLCCLTEAALYRICDYGGKALSH